MKPGEWLKQKRMEAGYTDNYLPVDVIKKIVLRKHGRIPDGLAKVLSKYASLTRSNTDDRLSAILSEAVKNILKPDEKHRALDVFIGIYPTYEVNGFATTTPEGDKVILLHNGLFLSLSLLANLLAVEFERTNSNRNIEEEELLEQIKYISSLWFPEFKEKFKIPSFGPKTEEYLIASSVLCISSMIFVLGHEYGHLIENHHSYTNVSKMNHEMEYIADLWGVRLLIRHMIFNRIPIEYLNYTLISIFLTLGLIAMISNDESNTHPSAENRMKKVRKAIHHVLKEEAKNIGYDGRVTNKSAEKMFISIGNKIFQKHIHYGNISKILRTMI